MNEYQKRGPPVAPGEAPSAAGDGLVFCDHDASRPSLSSSQGASGICSIAVHTSDAKTAVSEIAGRLRAGSYSTLILFFSPAVDALTLSAGLAAELPNTTIQGCSTAGEVSALGLTVGGVVAIAFPNERFRIHTEHIESLEGSSVEAARVAARRLLMRRDRTGTFKDAVALLLIDGLCNNEEMIVASISWEMEDVQLIGGSAGDGLDFGKTQLLHNGVIREDGAVLILIETTVPFKVFKNQNFDPTGTKLVVTTADAEKRIVYELNAEPAALEYAEAIGLIPRDLGPFTFASYPLVVRVGGEYYCRSIRNMNPDNSLTFFCAIDEGLVFTVANPVDMVWSTRETFESIEQSIGTIDTVIGFDCVLRRLDAENHQARTRLEELYRSKGLVGFQTYGEQFNAMHLNQTLTGVAFGAPPKAETE